MIAPIFCRVMGVVFILVALWGYIDGEHVLVFHVNAAHNTVHLLSGLVALACGFGGAAASRLFCLAFGTIYALVAVLGFAGVPSIVELLRLNTADNWLHLVLGAGFLGVGVLSAAPRPAPPVARA